LTITAAGLEIPGITTKVKTDIPGEASMTVFVLGAPPGSYNVTYSVSDTVGNTTLVSLPLSVGLGSNQTPILDPVSDLIVAVGQTLSFTIGLSDNDGDLDYLSQQTLVIDGIPGSSLVQFTRLTAYRIAIMITLKPQLFERGTYRVYIAGKDKRGGRTIAQMRIVVQ